MTNPAPWFATERVGNAHRWIGACSVVVGTVLAARPDLVAAAASGPRRLAPAWVRLLGARYLLQGVVQLVAPQPAVLAGAATVDALHGLSMVALAAASPDHRRPALLSAAGAAVGTAVNALAARRAHGAAR